MWMLAIFCPYIALIKLKRYTEATIIALIWLISIPVTIFSFGLLFLPMMGLLSITSVLAGLYTGQYYSAQRNDKLIGAIMSAAQLVSGKEVVAQPVQTVAPPTQESTQRAPTQMPLNRAYSDAPLVDAPHKSSGWSRNETLSIIAFVILVAGVISAASFPHLYQKCSTELTFWQIMGPRTPLEYTCAAIFLITQPLAIETTSNPLPPVTNSEPITVPSNSPAPTRSPPPIQEGVKIAPPPPPQPEMQQPIQPKQVATVPVTESPAPASRPPPSTRDTSQSLLNECLGFYLRCHGGSFVPEGHSTTYVKSRSDMTTMCVFAIRNNNQYWRYWGKHCPSR